MRCVGNHERITRSGALRLGHHEVSGTGELASDFIRIFIVAPVPYSHMEDTAKHATTYDTKCAGTADDTTRTTQGDL